MTQTPVMRRLHTTVSRYPWVMGAAQKIWRIARPRFSVGAVGVVLNEAHEILLVEHVFHPYHPWGLPGGWVEANEDPAQAVGRELREELELDVEVGPVVGAQRVFNGHLDLAYLCFPRGSVGKLCFELLDYRWVKPDNLPPTHAFHQFAIENTMKWFRDQPHGNIK